MPKRRSAHNSDDNDYGTQSDEEPYEPQSKKARKASTSKPYPRLPAKLSQARLSTAGGLTVEQRQPLTTCSLPPHTVSSHVISAKQADQMAAALVAWFEGVHAARGMPWRKPFDPTWTADERGQRAYEVWVSEVMLQQTQVATVIPYYNRWMEKFPTVQDLAAASIDSVHALWKGLGYYSRASRLLEGAKKAVDTPSWGGRLPTTAKGMQSDVPGVGRYSAGAICSIAYDERAPVLDGNVNRLLSRVLALHASPKAKLTLDILWAAATALVESSAAPRPGDLNQALIELGSTVCKPKDPACGACPIRTSCGAYTLQQRGSMCGSAADAVKPAENASDEQGTDVPDIEELCALCDPVLEEAQLRVTLFPMKAEKKKAREETDLVHVLEWRPDGEQDGKRWFLLIKRPEGGLLGGLQEFPTLPNVGDMSSAPEQMAKDALSVAQDYLSAPVLPLAKKAVVLDTNTQADKLRITRVKPAGEVLHVFSHIRKTYCLRWVILQGGSSPPALQARPVVAVTTKAKDSKAKKTAKPKAKAKGRRKDKDGDEDGEVGEEIVECAVNARWVQLDEVRDANIGTGVVKIWDRVRTLWEEV